VATLVKLLNVSNADYSSRLLARVGRKSLHTEIDPSLISLPFEALAAGRMTSTLLCRMPAYGIMLRFGGMTCGWNLDS